MAIAIGDIKIDGLYIGLSGVSGVYMGETLVYPEQGSIILYTSTDGQIVKPYSGYTYDYTSGWDGCTIISNTYENGIGKMVFDRIISRLPARVFCGCSSLKTITIPDSITQISVLAFGECVNLTSISIPNRVKEILGETFVFCTSLISVVIPETVTYFGGASFYGCSNLVSVSLPSGANDLYGMFNQCCKLQDVTYGGTISEWNNLGRSDDWKEGVPATCMVHCTDGDIAI